jgi:hypothetical protein
MPQQAALPESLTTNKLTSTPTDPTPAQPTSQGQLRPSSLCGGVPERSKPRPSRLLHLRFLRTQPRMTIGQRRHIFEPTLLPQKSIKVCSRSARRVGIATKAISSSSQRSRVWFAGEALPTRTIYGSPSPAQWDARSAMNSPFHCAAPITGTIIALATSRPGGTIWLSMPSGRHDSSGSRRDASNRSHQKSTRKRRKVWIEPRNLFESPVVEPLTASQIASPSATSCLLRGARHEARLVAKRN